MEVTTDGSVLIASPARDKPHAARSRATLDKTNRKHGRSQQRSPWTSKSRVDIEKQVEFLRLVGVALQQLADDELGRIAALPR